MSNEVCKLPTRDGYYSECPEELDAFQDLIVYLESLMNEVYDIDVIGHQRRFVAVADRVDTVRGMRISIYPNEHPPPHFHVKSANVNASFSIDDCSKLAGDISNRDYRKLKYWFDSSKSKLKEIWDKTRPTDCIVGNYREK